MPRKSECRTCQWWFKHDGGTQGDCRKKSPGVVEEDNSERYFIGTAIWPDTKPEDFCGNYCVSGEAVADRILQQIQTGHAAMSEASEMVSKANNSSDKLVQAANWWEEEWRKFHGGIPPSPAERHSCMRAILRFAMDDRI